MSENSPQERRRRRLTFRATQSAVLRAVQWTANKQGVQMDRLRKAPCTGRALATYSRYYRTDLHDATTSIIGVMGVLYGAWAWMNTLARAQRTI